MKGSQEKVLGLIKKGKNKKLYVTHLTIRQSISILIIKLILIDIITATIFFTSYSLLFNSNMFEFINLSTDFYNTVIFLILVIGKIFLTIYLVLEWVNEYYEITPTAITHKRGIIFREVKRHDVPYIRSVKLTRSLLGRLLNFGTLRLVDIRLNTDINLYLIHNPIKYLRVLEYLIPELEEEKKFFREKALEDGME